MTADKLLVIKFFKTKGIEARHFPKKSAGKQADFELYLGSQIFGYCELKSILDYKFSGLINDPTYNKVQSKIHQAANQFRSVNPNHLNPNILFFINHRERVGWQDLWYVLTGEVTPPDQRSEPIDTRYLSRLLRNDDLAIVDYFIWADTFGTNIKFFIVADSAFSAELRGKISSKEYEKINIREL